MRRALASRIRTRRVTESLAGNGGVTCCPQITWDFGFGFGLLRRLAIERRREVGIAFDPAEDGRPMDFRQLRRLNKRLPRPQRRQRRLLRLIQLPVLRRARQAEELYRLKPLFNK